MNGSSHMAPKPRWLIVGAGSFGTAFARVLSHNGELDVTLAARTEAHAARMRDDGSNERFFPGMALPDELTVATLDAAAAGEWDAIVLAVPASAVAETLEVFSQRAPVFVSLAKGLAPDGRRISEVAAQFVDVDRLVVVSGPNIAYEIMHDLPTAAVVAGTSLDTVRRVQVSVNTLTFRVYANRDLVGVELAGATKNVVAIAAGICEGAGFGANGLSALTTRGLGEMARYGLAQGAQIETYLGLAGVGDLFTTCTSPHSRNHRAGRLFAEGRNADEVRAEIGQVIEGLRTAPVVAERAAELGVPMNVCDAVAALASGRESLTEVAQRLVSRQPDLEFDVDPRPARFSH